MIDPKNARPIAGALILTVGSVGVRTICDLSGEAQHERVEAMHATANVAAYAPSLSTPISGFWIGWKA